jgi:pimeloyl-ACP methyl ester carboxylesterase
VRFDVAEVTGQRVRVGDAGSGDPVVVLHGWGGRIESMHPAVACLQERFRVLALDLPGFGESPAPRGAWGTPDYAELVRDVAVELGLEKAHFIGHSFGAKVAFYLAGIHPDLVDKLVLVASSGIRLPPSLEHRAKRVAGRAARYIGALGPPGRRIKLAIHDRIASDDYKQAGELREILVRVVNEDLRGFLPRVRASTLLVWGSEDDATPIAAAREMERLLPNAGLAVFEGAGHFCYLDQPERFCRVVRHFLGAPVA